MRLKDKEIQVARELMCDALFELGHSTVLDFFMTVVNDLKTFQAPPVTVPKGPGETVKQLKGMIKQAKCLIHANAELKELVPQATKKEIGLLRQFEEIILKIEQQVQAALAKLAARKLTPKKLELAYHKIAKETGIPITKKLLEQHKVVSNKLGKTSASLRHLLEVFQMNPMTPVERSCVCIDMARYSLLARQIQATQDAKALFDFNRKLQAQFRCALTVVGAKPGQVAIDDTGDGALLFLADADMAVNFAIEVLKAGFAKNLEIPNKEWHQHVRIGIDTGKVMLDLKRMDGKVVSFNSAGVPIINAVRIQSKCSTGRVAVSRVTWGKLSSEHQALFGKFKSLKPDKKKHEPALEMCITKAGAGLS